MSRYKKEEIKKRALKAIEKYKLVFIKDIEAYLPVTRQTFYKMGLEKDEDINELITENKINIKVGLRQKWYKSNNATLQLNLYKLVATAEERDILNAWKLDITNDDVTHLTPDERAARIVELRKKLDGDK
jgi:hypothetical protein